MAVGQHKKHKKFDPVKKGANDPIQASQPAEQKYRFPIEKGLAKLNPKIGADGNPLAISEYGRRYSGPTSVSVQDSDQMADFDIAPSDKDPALENLKSGGSPVADDDPQLRTVSNEPYPVAGGGSMKRQQDPNFFAKKPA